MGCRYNRANACQNKQEDISVQGKLRSAWRSIKTDQYISLCSYAATPTSPLENHKCYMPPW